MAAVAAIELKVGLIGARTLQDVTDVSKAVKIIDRSAGEMELL